MESENLIKLFGLIKLINYRKEAQRCYCETPVCRGWIGEDPDKEGKWSDMSSRKERREKERKKKEERKRDVKDLLNDMDVCGISIFQLGVHTMLTFFVTCVVF